MCGTSRSKGFGTVSSMPIVWTAPGRLLKGSDSAFPRFSWTRSRRQFRGHRTGISGQALGYDPLSPERADIYTTSGKGPECSINFVTCHDGFTLNDLVSYRYKHNEANGENNQDGTNASFSENCGVEGETEDAAIESVRKRQIKNFLVTLLTSRGVPMLLGGDEFRRTQRGNNNAWRQDNDTSWFDWSYLEQHREIFRFARGMIAFRRAHPVLSTEQFYTDDTIQWRGPAGGTPDWFDRREKALACIVQEKEKGRILMMFNAGPDSVDFHLPQTPDMAKWLVAVDTSSAAPGDLFAEGEEPIVDSSKPYILAARSSAILLARERTA